MPDREKVIKGLEQFKADFKPFCGNGADWRRVDDAINMLRKEQEAVPVVQREIAHMLFWCCGSCGVAITDGDKFCRNCGRKVKWDA